jgi:hypothetical protein
VLALAVVAKPAAAQTLISIEGHAEVGYNNVDAPGWLGIGVFDVGRLVTGGDVQVIFSRQRQRGLQVGLEAGYQRLLSYNFIVGGQPTAFSSDAIRLAVSSRFWLSEGAWFGEASFGSYFFNGSAVILPFTISSGIQYQLIG